MQTSIRIFAALALAFAAASPAQKPASGGQSSSTVRPRTNQGAEAAAARAYQAAVKAGPETLRAFLVQFPKGADLHIHLSGAVYAETFIREAAEDGLCADTVELRFAKPPCQGKLIPADAFTGDMSGANQEIYDRLIDAFSMRSFVPVNEFSGHDQFFSVFLPIARFNGLKESHIGEWVDEVASRAASQNEQYLELMQTPSFGHAAQIAHDIGWNTELGRGDAAAFAQFRRELLDHGLRDEIAADRTDVRMAEDGRKKLERCGTPQATPACRVQVRYLYQVLRDFPPEQVFAQTLLGFETVQASLDARDDTWVGINFVMPEDWYISMRDYTLQMKIVGYLHSVYPKVHISLHAGELALGLVPPEGLRFHVRQAVELGNAERIGHGVDVMYEDNAQNLLKELAQKHIMIEINLSSNEEILGVKGAEHPFPVYLAAKVPVALSTDDEGVSRIDLTHEYVRAALDYNLSYADLKKLARTGMEHDFLPGASLWARPDDFTLPNSACKGETPGGEEHTLACKKFLDENEKAAAQWELERRFRAFEAKF